MALPFLDLVLAYARRTMNGTWWFVADKQHLHHRLLQRGHSQVRACLLMYLWTGIISFGVIAVGLTQRWVAAGGMALLLVIAALLTWWPKTRKA